MQSGRLNKKIAQWSVLAAAFAAFFVVRWLLGSSSLCLFRNLTGLPCPGCGLTSAGLALLRGEVTQSLRFHPFLLPVLATLAVALLHRQVPLFGRLHRSRVFYPLLLALIVGFYLVRMGLYFPGGPYPMEYARESVAGKIIALVQSFDRPSTDQRPQGRRTQDQPGQGDPGLEL